MYCRYVDIGTVVVDADLTVDSICVVDDEANKKNDDARFC